MSKRKSTQFSHLPKVVVQPTLKTSVSEPSLGNKDKRRPSLTPPRLQINGRLGIEKYLTRRGSSSRSSISSIGPNDKENVGTIADDLSDNLNAFPADFSGYYKDDFDDVIPPDFIRSALLCEQPLFGGSNLNFYRPLRPEDIDRIMFLQGTEGRQETHRQTAPEISTGTTEGFGGWKRSQSIIDPSARDIASQSSSSEPSRRNSLSGKRLSLVLRSTSLLERAAPDRKNKLRNTRKFIYSLARVAKKSEKSEAEDNEGTPRWTSSLGKARSLGVRVMLKREQMQGGQRMAALGTIMAAQRRFSMKDHYVVQFDPTLVWKKVKLWVKIRGILERMHEDVIATVTHDPASPLYAHSTKTEDIGIDRSHYMFFDPSNFKANRQMRTSQEVKRVLSLPPGERTQEDVHCAMIGLRGINTIAEFPVRMQRYLALYGTFQSLNAKRAIVRQGKPPEAFYYILYGRVLVAVRDEVTGKVEIKCYLHRGHSFGELAIIRDTQRQSTVITKNYTELLCLSSEVFQKYFMVGGVKNINDPDQVGFVKSLPFLRGWPLELILNNTDNQNMTFGYFKRGSILSKDSNFSDWLIIVKSGSLTVLKKLIRATPTASKKTGMLRVPSQCNFLDFLDSGSDYIRGIEMSDSPFPFSVSVTPDEELNSDVSDDEVGHVTLANRPHTTVCRRPLTRGSRGFLSSMGKSESSLVEFKSDTVMMKYQKRDFLSASPPKTPRNRAVSKELSADDVLELEDKRTFLDDLDSAYNARANIVTAADLNPQFVFVQTLTKGDVFGLAQCLFLDQPSMCVVSNGADCLLLSKKLFLDHCTSALIRRLRVEVSPYPSDSKLQEDLVTRINWDVYKSAVRKQLYKGHKKSDRKLS